MLRRTQAGDCRPGETADVADVFTTLNAADAATSGTRTSDEEASVIGRYREALLGWRNEQPSQGLCDVQAGRGARAAMMWNLTPLASCDAREHLNIAFVNGEITEVEKDFLVGLYHQYAATLGRQSEAMQAAGQRPELYDLLHDAYSLVQENRRLSKLRADLKLLADYCPYCGFAPISDLDHHLQRGRFKLLSIFALNLVPCCSPCNTGKKRAPPDDPAKQQLHTYLESVANFDFLRASVALHPDTGALEVSYSIGHCLGMSEELYQRLENHLTEFDLHKKYAKQVNIHLSEHEFGMTMAYESGAQILRNYLIGTAGAHKQNFGANDWRAALFEGLALCDGFCNGGFKTALGRTSKAVVIQPVAADTW